MQGVSSGVTSSAKKALKHEHILFCRRIKRKIMITMTIIMFIAMTLILIIVILILMIIIVIVIIIKYCLFLMLFLRKADSSHSLKKQSEYKIEKPN